MSSSLTALRERLDEGDRRLFDELEHHHLAVGDARPAGSGEEPHFRSTGNVWRLLEEQPRHPRSGGERSECRVSRALPAGHGRRRAGADSAGGGAGGVRRLRAIRSEGVTEARTHGELRYVACVIPHDGDVHVRDLGTAQDVDRAVERFREALRDPNADPKRARASPRRGWSWSRCESCSASGVTRLLLSPDGAVESGAVRGARRRATAIPDRALRDQLPDDRPRSPPPAGARVRARPSRSSWPTRCSASRAPAGRDRGGPTAAAGARPPQRRRGRQPGERVLRAAGGQRRTRRGRSRCCSRRPRC